VSPVTQAGILSPITLAGRYVTVSLVPGAPARELIGRLRQLRIDDTIVVGVGEPFVRAVNATVPGLRTFPALSGPGCSVPSTQGALLLHTRDTDHGGSLHAMLRALAVLGDHIRIDEDLVSFKHGTGRDLSGFEDGTENPKDDAAVAAAIVAGAGPGLDGSSFVAAQRWIHDLRRLEGFDATTRNALIGRDVASNTELADAPVHAHIRRSQQESYDPPAFMVRRSMPYGTAREHGLFFIAYVAALAAFERMMTRMAGIDDGIVDGLFQFSRPVSGGYYWCPPVDGHALDLRALDGA